MDSYPSKYLSLTLSPSSSSRPRPSPSLSTVPQIVDVMLVRSTTSKLLHEGGKKHLPGELIGQFVSNELGGRESDVAQ